MKELFLVLVCLGVVYALIVKLLANQKETLCINPVKCGTTELENVLKYDWKTEPNNPFYTSHMVVPKLPEKYSGENVKTTYLNNANKVYGDIENDMLNAALVPKSDYLFVYP
jgi:hypothetical protein